MPATSVLSGNHVLWPQTNASQKDLLGNISKQNSAGRTPQMSGAVGADSQTISNRRKPSHARPAHRNHKLPGSLAFLRPQSHARDFLKFR
jgi:hypothetical protein